MTDLVLLVRGVSTLPIENYSVIGAFILITSIPAANPESPQFTGPACPLLNPNRGFHIHMRQTSSLTKTALLDLEMAASMNRGSISWVS